MISAVFIWSLVGIASSLIGFMMLNIIDGEPAGNITISALIAIIILGAFLGFIAVIFAVAGVAVCLFTMEDGPMNKKINLFDWNKKK